jgi:hypothetical protein
VFRPENADSGIDPHPDNYLLDVDRRLVPADEDQVPDNSG